MKPSTRLVMRFLSLLLLMPSLIAGCATSSRGAPFQSAATAIAMELLERGARAWNRGDLDAFMADYADGSRTTYVTSAGFIRGRSAIGARYAPRFAPGAMRDSLSFENVDADWIGPETVHVVAWYKLMRGDSLTARGPTSLVLIREGERWVILKDHSG